RQCGCFREPPTKRSRRSAAPSWSTNRGRGGGDIELTLYAGATHDFDDPGTERRSNPANATATNDAMPRAGDFFARLLRVNVRPAAPASPAWCAGSGAGRKGPARAGDRRPGNNRGGGDAVEPT